MDVNAADEERRSRMRQLAKAYYWAHLEDIRASKRQAAQARLMSNPLYPRAGYIARYNAGKNKPNPECLRRYNIVFNAGTGVYEPGDPALDAACIKELQAWHAAKRGGAPAT